MKRLELSDIPEAAVFEACRDELRGRIIAHKDLRRVEIGDRVTLLFEDRETLRWQVLEMCRVEGTRDAAGIQHELDVYNELIPGEDELTATLFIEITDLAEIRPALDRLVGLDEHVTLEVGGHAVRAVFDPDQMEDDRISAVQYIRFRFPAEAAAAFRAGEPATLGIDHPNYTCRARLAPEVQASLAADLAGGCAPLVDFDAVAPAALPEETVVLARGRVRAVRPARGRAEGHVCVEVPGDARPYLELPEDLTAELHALALEMARGVTRTHGRCRISVDATAVPARIDVYAPPGPAR